VEEQHVQLPLQQLPAAAAALQQRGCRVPAPADGPPAAAVLQWPWHEERGGAGHVPLLLRKREMFRNNPPVKPKAVSY